MAIWDVDFTTRDGARSAVQHAAIACFVFCAMCVLGVLLQAMAGAMVPALVALGQAVVALVAGLRLRSGKGLWVGGLTTVLLVADVAVMFVAFSFGGLIVSAFLLVMLVVGLRGAWALRDAPSAADAELKTYA